MKLLFALLLIFASRPSLGCPNGLAWKNFSSVSISSKNSASVSLVRFTDAIYVKIEDGSRTKEMYQLESGPVLFRGVSPSELTKTSPFLMLDMPISIVLSLLSHQFKEPCSVSLSKTQFSYVLPPNKLGTDAANVTGSATRDNDTVIIYEINFIEAREQGATIQMSGKIEFSAINHLPANTAISDWVITTHDTDGTNPEKLLELNIVANSIEDLRTLGLFGRKP